MQTKIFVAVFLLISFVACKPKKAIEFKEAITRKEADAKDILLKKGSIEEEKLQCLLKQDFKGAVLAIDKEEQAFNNLIRGIETLSTEGVKQGTEVKTAALNYYTALRDVYTFDKNEIPLREASWNTSPEKAKLVQDSLLQLSKNKLKMNAALSAKEEAFYQALQQFNTANGL